MISTLVIAAAILLSWTVYRQTRPQIRRNGLLLKIAPNTWPVLGNAIQFLQPRHVLFGWFTECERRFGKETFAISVPFLPPGVVINDPVNVEFVLKNETSITKGDFFKVRSWDLFGYGIINASGELWKVQRKAGLKFFSGTNLEIMVDEVLPELYGKTQKLLVESARDRRVIDMAKVFLDLTTAVVGQMAYDMEIDASSPFSKAFDYASDHVGLRFQNPLYNITEIFTGSRFRLALAEVKKFGRDIVTNAKRYRSQIAYNSLLDGEEPVFGTLIDSLIETFEQPEVIADSALNFLSAGRDTTAQSLTWTLYCLLRHPNAAEQLRNETAPLITASKTRTQSTSPSTTELQPMNLPHTMAIFYEALRLYPPVPFELKQCSTDITLPDGTFLPASSIVLWCIWAMNRSKLYGEDADTFRPERWLDEHGKFVPRSAFEFPVFNGGARACLGKKMAETMAMYVLTVLLRDFEFEEVFDEALGKRERVSQNSLTLPMAGGLPCRVRVRNSARIDSEAK